MELGRKPDKHEVALVEPGVDECDNKRMKAVVGDISTQMSGWFKVSSNLHTKILLFINTVKQVGIHEELESVVGVS